MPRDPYTVLGVSRDAEQSEVKKSYHKLAMKYHPDKNPGNADAAAKKFKEIQGAYAVLSDPEKRQFFDRWGRSPDEQGPASNSRGFHTGGAADVDDLFQAFFGGGPRRRRTSNGAQQQQAGPVNPLAGLLQMLPLILLLLMSLGGNLMGGGGYEEEKMFSFGRNAEFRSEMETASGVSFYVKRDYFLEIQSSVDKRQQLYSKVDNAYEQHLARECEYERQQKAHLEGTAEDLDDPGAAQTAREYRATSCDLYRRRYGHFPSQRFHRGNSRNGGYRGYGYRGF